MPGGREPENLVEQWLAKGAKPTETVHNLIRRG